MQRSVTVCKTGAVCHTSPECQHYGIILRVRGVRAACRDSGEKPPLPTTHHGNLCMNRRLQVNRTKERVTCACQGPFNRLQPLMWVGWTALSTDEVTSWLNAALGTRDARGPGRLTSHGLKATLLKWCFQYGLSEEVREVLGQHMGRGSLSVAATQEIAKTVLESVRRGLFLPDLTRVGGL